MRTQRLFSHLSIAVFLVIALTALPAQAQTGTVSGTVFDAETQNPLPGTNVVIQGTQQGATTDSQGEYEITGVEPGDYTVLASFVGYQDLSKEITVQSGQTSELDFQLPRSAMQMDEVVTIGYGQQERRDVTGSISSIEGGDLQQVSTKSIGLGLQGLAAGVYVQRGRSKPGDQAAQIRIRGSRSITAGNEPLFVIDGVPLTGGGLQGISPQNVESVEVLKDASATAIYGARGSNGVVLITTDRGYEGQMSVTYNGYVGAITKYKELDMMSGQEFAALKRESRRTTGDYPEGVSESADQNLFTPVELESLNQGRSTDWPALLTETGTETNHNLSVSGGTQDLQFNVSFEALLEDGIIPQQDYQRYNTRVNLDANVFDWLSIGTSTFASYSIQDHADTNPYFEALQNNPLGPAFAEQTDLREAQDGELIFLPTDDGLQSNPLYDVKENQIIDREQRYRLLNSIFTDISLTDNLNYRLQFSPDLIQVQNSDFAASLTNQQRFAEPDASKAENFILNYTVDNRVTYGNVFADIHDVSFTGLFSYQRREQDGVSTSVRGIPVESMLAENLGAASTIESADSFYEEWSLVSYMTRGNYVYDDRYLLTLTGRIDGSSRFGENNRFGVFPSAALGWNIQNEAFMEDSELFDALRVRLSWGQSGNTAIDPYQTLSLLNRTTYAYGSEGGFGYEPGQLSNADLQWETSATWNLGVEFEVLNSRLSGSLDAYVTNTEDLLLARQIPQTSGFNSVLQNVGKTRNKGIELSLQSVNISSQDPDGFRWTTGFNISYNDTEIRQLFGDQEDDVGNEWFIGEPINVIYGYKKIGIWQQDEAQRAAEFGQEPGEIKVQDRNGDNAIGGADRFILGQENPPVNAGFNTQLSYKGVSLSATLVGQFGHMIISDPHDDVNSLFGRYNNLDVDYWTPDNPDGAYPRPNQNQEFPIYGQTLSFFSGDFIKVRSVTLGYNLPQSLVQQINAESLRLYLKANQPFIFSPYVQNHKGIDPEYPELSTPSTRTFRFGVNLTL